MMDKYDKLEILIDAAYGRRLSNGEVDELKMLVFQNPAQAEPQEGALADTVRDLMEQTVLRVSSMNPETYADQGDWVGAIHAEMEHYADLRDNGATPPAAAQDKALTRSIALTKASEMAAAQDARELDDIEIEQEFPVPGCNCSSCMEARGGREDKPRLATQPHGDAEGLREALTAIATLKTVIERGRLVDFDETHARDIARAALLSSPASGIK
jgi:hypothetical protein